MRSGSVSCHLRGHLGPHLLHRRQDHLGLCLVAGRYRRDHRADCAHRCVQKVVFTTPVAVRVEWVGLIRLADAVAIDVFFSILQSIAIRVGHKGIRLIGPRLPLRLRSSTPSKIPS